LNKKEQKQLIDVIDRLARIEVRLEEGFKSVKENFSEVKGRMKVINEEMGRIDDRMDALEARQDKAEQIYRRTLLYWKGIAFIISPLLTIVLSELVRRLIGG